MTERLGHTPGTAALLDNITRQSPWGQIVLEERHEIVLWNAWVESASGIPATFALGERIEDVFSDLPSRVLQAIEESLRTGMSSVLSRAFLPHPFPLGNRQFRDRPMFQSVTISGFRGDDERRYCLINILDASNEVQREDILRQRTADLERSKAALEEANRDLEAFTHMVGHDLRAPVRRIRSFVRHLRTDLGDEPDAAVRGDLEAIELSARRLADIVQATYRLSKPQRDVLRIEHFPLADALEPAVDILQETDAWGNAVITCGDLPVVDADRGLLERVFQNLLDNALKYRGDRPARIHVTAESRADEVLIGVRDHGCGIDPADADRLLAPFQRALASLSVEGLGIGLTICHRVVERHGGRIWFEPVEAGTLVRFSLPQPAPTH
ncbi:MAG TPA: hypothetical protein ENI87_10995 [bacterium]|nr:hypothetical protein [bacterium]